MLVRVKRLYSLAQFNNIEIELEDVLEEVNKGEYKPPINQEVVDTISKMQRMCDLSFYNYVEQQKRLKESVNAKQLLEEELGE